MSIAGYEAAREKSEIVVRALRDIATLIGEPSEDEIALETGGTLTPGMGMKDDAAAVALRARDLEQGLFKLIVLGEFKNGKSTLINGMLGTKVLPAKAAPATAVITVLVNGKCPDVAIYESGTTAPRLVSWESFVAEFQLTIEDQETLHEQGFVDRFRNIEYAQIECRHPICANGVKLIDSPGLGEHIGRTRVATNFLRQAQAVIFVLNATKILSRDEKDFIEHSLGEGRLGHVFFVINRINQIDEESVEEIKSWVERELRHHFLDPDGEFDRDFYTRRVFFVNAKGALDARAVAPNDLAQLKASGVPALERELERFLTSEEKIAAALESTVQFLIPVIAHSRNRTEQTKAALDRPLEELERRRSEADQQLEVLSGRKFDIERTIVLLGDTIKQKVYADLRSYIDEMRANWPEDSQQLMNLDRAVSFKNLFTSFARKDAKEQMARTIGEEVQKYIQAKFGQWSQRIPALIHRDVETMMVEIEAQIEDFRLELDRIAALFSGTTPSSSATSHGSVNGANLLNLTMTLSDIGGLTESAIGPGDWASFVAQVIQQTVVVFVVGTLLTGGNFLIALVIVEAIHLGMQEGEVKKRIRERLGERLFENLHEQIIASQAFIYQSMQERFASLASHTTGTIEKQIDEVRAEQERIIRQKHEEHFSIENEKQRLDAIQTKLQQLFMALSEAGYPHVRAASAQ